MNENKLNKNELKIDNDFPETLSKDWLEQINKDLKLESYEKHLVHNVDDNINLNAYYRNEDLKNINIINSRENQILQNSNTLNHNKIFAKLNLENILLDYINNEYKNYTDIENLLETEKNLVKIENHINKKIKELIDLGANYLSFYLYDNINIKYNIRLIKIILNQINYFESIDFNIQVSDFYLINFLNLISEIENNKTKINNIKVEYDFIENWLTKGFLNLPLEETQEKLFECLIKNSFNKLFKISDYVSYEGGAKPTFSLSIILAYLNEWLNFWEQKAKEKIKLNEFLEKFIFELGVSSNFFLEIGRLRAFRLLFIKLIESYEADFFSKNQFHKTLFLKAKSLSANKTNYDTPTNLIRNSTETMSAILANVDFFESCSFNFEKNQNLSESLSILTQQLHINESYLNKILDPSSGSYYIEKLTDELAKNAWEKFKLIEKEGGLFELIRSEKLYKIIEKDSKERLEQIINREINLLGINQFPPLTIFKNSNNSKLTNSKNLNNNTLNYKKQDNKNSNDINQNINNSDNKNLNDINQNINNSDNKNSNDINQNINNSDNENLNDKSLNNKKLNKYEIIKTIEPLKLSSIIEKIRLKTENYFLATNEIPFTVLINFGDQVKAKLRSNFSLNILGCAGLKIIENDFETDIENIVPSKLLIKIKLEQCNPNSSFLLVLCSADEIYIDKFREVNLFYDNIIKFFPKSILYIACSKKTKEILNEKINEKFKESNKIKNSNFIDGYLYQGINLEETLNQIQSKILKI